MNHPILRLAVLSALATLAMPSHGAESDACTALLQWNAGDERAVIQKAERVPAGPRRAPPGAPPAPEVMLPAHCLVEGFIDQRTGRNGKPYAIGFAIAMPGNWNGRFLFQGGGGLNGSLNPPLGTVAAGDQPALARGFAVVSTDSGHRGAVFDSSFFDDQEAALNFLYQAVAKTTVLGKRVVARYYGRAPEHAYFAGCSTGGREAMMMSQRYPDYFDGIIAGAPAMRTNYSNLATRWLTTSLNAAAPKDAQGRAQTDKALSPSDRRLVVDGLLKACDARDGVADGMIFDVRGCRFDPAVLACKGAKRDDCLSTVQVEAIRKGFAGPKTRGGVAVYPGFPFDTGIAATGAGIPGLLVSGMSPVGPSPTGTTMDVDAEAAEAHDARSMAGDTNAWTNLSTFTARNGKLMFFHGVSDPWFSALDTIQYYERLAHDNAPLVAQDWSRLYLVPGMGHCAGGERTLDRFDLLTPLVDWVENGRAPTPAVATGASQPGRSRPLCEWPKHAHYDGRGNPDDARSYSCAESAP